MNKYPQNILITGATSGIGRGLCLEYLKRGCKIAITGRRANLLAEVKSFSPAKVFTYLNDVWECKAPEIIKQAAADMGGIDTIIICAGTGDINFDLAEDIELCTVRTNVLGFTDYAIAGYKYLADYCSRTEVECRLAGISSIASFRGSYAAPAYYASKAYVSNYLEGLRIKAYKSGFSLSVTTVIPGFIDTALAKGVGGTEGLFWVAPVSKACRQISVALDKKKEIVYITKKWRIIAWLLKVLPAWLYRKI